MAIVGVSGSPIVGGNTDRMVRALLEKSGKDYTFVNLSTLRYDPCRACAHLCSETNLCPVDDDLKPFLEPLLEARALVLGTPIHNHDITGWMFSFATRLWCFYHVKNLLRNKPLVLVVTGLTTNTEKWAIPRFAEALREACHAENVVGHVFYASYIPPCYKCGRGNVCRIGGLAYMLDRDEERLKNFRLTPEMFRRWENCPDTVAKIELCAEMLARL
jgi:multimeric flavodoxin WrbA